MNVSISKELQKYIDEEVESGRFDDASAVVNDALRLHEAYIGRLREKVGEGLDDIESGRHRAVTAAEFLARARSALS